MRNCPVCGDPFDGDGLQCPECRTPEGRARKMAQAKQIAGSVGQGDERPTRVGQGATEPEATEQQNGLDWLQAHGWRTWRIGQRDARGTQDPGVPDVVAMKPGVGLIWWECKGKGGRQSTAQKNFQATCERANVRYVLGGFAALRVALEHEQREMA